MKPLNLLDIGIYDDLEFYEKREVRIVNLFSIIIFIGLLFGAATILFVNNHYPTPTVIFTFLCAFSMLFFNYKKQHNVATYVFVITINASIFILNKQYNESVGNYLYYFPVIFCIALIHNPLKSSTRTVIFFGITLLSFIATQVFSLEFMKIKTVTPEDEKLLFIYNLSLTVLITMILVVLVLKLINKQNNEVVSLLDKEHDAQAKIAQSLKEKEILLAEIQHRVKNNLAVITGLLNLQTEKAPCETSKNLMVESRNRVMSIAMVHERLYKKDNLAKIDFKQYLSELVNEVVSSFPSKHEIEIKEELDNAEIEITKAVPIGLILNEALTNSLKHAFQTEEIANPKIKIKMQTIYDRMHISLSDNGKGFEDLEHRKDSSLGVSLIESLADQIDAKVVFRNENGATVSLVFPI